MRIIITGHTQGLGKAFYDHFSKEHEVTGVSRTTGYVLPDDLKRIEELCQGADLLFNNAHVGLVQADIIKNLYNTLPIVTSGSMAANHITSGSVYNVEKRAIEIAHTTRKKISKYPMLLLKMGYLENYVDKASIPYSQVINAVDLWMSNPRISMIEFDNLEEK